MINRVILVGRLTKDPVLTTTQSGIAVTRFTLAVNRAFKGQDGEQQADFINIVVWRKQAESVAKYLKKGSLAGVEGRIQTGSYEGNDGKRVYTTEVVADSVQFLESKGTQSGSQQQTQTNTQSQAQTQQRASQQQTQYQVNQNNEAFGQSNTVLDVQDDDLPF